jgi:hypothetical protein
MPRKKIGDWRLRGPDNKNVVRETTGGLPGLEE